MYYFIEHSTSKTLHTFGCRHLRGKRITGELSCCKSLENALHNGYKFCKTCSSTSSVFNEQKSEVKNFCQENGLDVYFEHGTITVVSREKWKIVRDGDGLLLYHKNKFKADANQESTIPGYHLQKTPQNSSVIDLLEYINQHDYFRMLHPAQGRPKKKAPPKKGTKRYKKAQKHAKLTENRRAVANVIRLINSLQMTPSHV